VREKLRLVRLQVLQKLGNMFFEFEEPFGGVGPCSGVIGTHDLAKHNAGCCQFGFELSQVISGWTNRCIGRDQLCDAARLRPRQDVIGAVD